MGPWSHIGQDVFKAVRRLPVSKRVDQIILNPVFKIKSGTPPDYTIGRFTQASSVHSYSTRFRENGLYFSPKSLKLWQKVFCISGMHFME